MRFSSNLLYQTVVQHTGKIIYFYIFSHVNKLLHNCLVYCLVSFGHFTLSQSSTDFQNGIPCLIMPICSIVLLLLLDICNFQIKLLNYLTLGGKFLLQT